MPREIFDYRYNGCTYSCEYLNALNNSLYSNWTSCVYRIVNKTKSSRFGRCKPQRSKRINKRFRGRAVLHDGVSTRSHRSFAIILAADRFDVILMNERPHEERLCHVLLFVSLASWVVRLHKTFILHTFNSYGLVVRLARPPASVTDDNDHYYDTR